MKYYPPFIIVLFILVVFVSFATIFTSLPLPGARSAVGCSLHPSGDANCDGLIDQADFEIWRKEKFGELTTKTADFNSDSSVDIIDFEIWRKRRFDQVINTPVVTSIPSPTNIPILTPTRIPTGTVIPTSPPAGQSKGIWISQNEIKSLPISGQAGCASGSLCYNAWNALIAKADSNWGAPDIDTYDLPHEEGVLAAAIASVRLRTEPGRTADAQRYYDKAVAGLMAVIGTERESVPNPDGSGGKTDGSLAIARNTAEYVISADIIGLYPDGNPNSNGTKWGNYANYLYHQKFTFRVGDGGEALDRNLPGCASNGCAMGGGAHIALALYLNDKTAVDLSWLQFRRYTGDRTAGQEITFSGTGQNWYHNDAAKMAINPKGATCQGTSYPADGVIPNDQGRGGTCPSSANTAPGYTQYPWEGMQGAYLMAVMLHHQGYKDPQGKNPWQINDNALLRAIQYQSSLQTKFGGSWYDSGRAAWVKHLANIMYGYKPLDYAASGGGRNMDFTQWTHPR